MLPWKSLPPMVPSGGDAAQAPAHNVRMSNSQLAKLHCGPDRRDDLALSGRVQTPREIFIELLIGSGVQAVRQPFTEDHRVLDGELRPSAKYPVPVVR